MWASSVDWLVEPVPDRVLSSLNFKLVFGLTVLNAVLWLTSTVLQFVLVSKVDVTANVSTATLLGISAGWSLLIFIVTLGSMYGLYRNTIKHVRSFITMTVTTAALSLLIFLFHVITLSVDSADEQWLSPGGFTIFTGLYVCGESCIIDFYVFYLWKSFCKEMKEARMDKMRQMLQQEQQNQLETLIQSSGSLPLPPSNRYSIGSTVAEHTVEAHHEISSEGNDRITFYPPVFV